MTEKIIILKTVRYGDADLVIHGLTPQGAKLPFFAKSAMKSRKRFGGGVLEPTHFVKIRCSPPRSGEGMARLEEAILLEGFAGLRRDYERLEIGLHFVSLVSKISLEGMTDSSEMFHLLGNALRAAELSPRLGDLKLHFELRLLAAQGVLPHLEGAERLLDKPLKEHEDLALTPQQRTALSDMVTELMAGYVGS